MSLIDKLKELFCINKNTKVRIDKNSEEFIALKDKYKSLMRNSLRIKIGDAAKEESITHFGGTPLVPNDFKWPYFETASIYNPEEIKPRPLAFLAQFDCRELAKFDIDNLLPHTGVLSFFYSIESDCWGYDPKDRNCSRVFWFEDINELVPITLPKDLNDDYIFSSLSISIDKEESYPDYEILPKKFDLDEYEMFYEVLHQRDENISKLLGWADTIQTEMETQCELVNDNYYLGGSYDNIPKEVLKNAEDTALDKWVLLFQLDTVMNKNFELMFGDDGRIYFWIRKEDLIKRDFDKTWLILQCF